jgi:two-component system cell cycle sensor histidine kinase/response regulator CckA
VPAVEKLRDLPERRGVMPLRGIQVLVVDDEEALRRPVVRFLTRRGARVLEAGDGVEALSRLDEAKGDVHAILADLRMPRMDGLAMHAVLQTTRPELAERVVFLSGDVSHLAERGDHAVPPDRVLLKPVALEEVEHRLLQVANWTGPTS